MRQRLFTLSLVSLLCLIGACLALLSLYLHTKATSPIDLGKSFCEISEKFNCVPVYRSKWAVLFGLPVAGIALWYYLMFFSLSVVARDEDKMSAATAADLFTTVSILSLVYSLYLLYVSSVLIGAQCLVCMLMDVVNLGLLAAAFILPGSPLSGRFTRGATMLILYPATLLGIGRFSSPAHRWLLRGSLLLGVVLFVFSIAMEIPFRLYWHDVMQRSRAELALSGVQKWQDAQFQKIDINSDSALTMDHAKGPESAPIQIVEFVDLQCPACKASYEMLEQLLLEYDDKVRLILKNYPLNEECNQYFKGRLHENACFAAEFSRCAGEQGAFWAGIQLSFELTEMLDPRHGTQTFREEALLAAGSAGMDQDALQECVDSDRHLQKIKGDVQEGKNLGVQVTPSMWINGKKVTALHPDVLRPIFDRILKGP